MARNGKTSPWVYVAIGCAVVVVLAIVAVVGLGFFGYRWAKKFEAELKDPAEREKKVLAVLGAEELPPGYHPMVGMSIPFVMDMAMLSDVPVPEGGEPDDAGFEERGFFYFKMLSTGKQRRELDDFFEGRIDDAEFLRQSSIDLKRGEVIARGDLSLPATDGARYIAQRGSIAWGGRGSRGEGLTSTILVECAGDSRMRLAMWFGPDPQPEADPGAADLSGSVADPEALAAFLGHFRFCG
jgi:hypothetical protein